MIQWASKATVKLAQLGNHMFCSCPARTKENKANPKLFAVSLVIVLISLPTRRLKKDTY